MSASGPGPNNEVQLYLSEKIKSFRGVAQTFISRNLIQFFIPERANGAQQIMPGHYTSIQQKEAPQIDYLLLSKERGLTSHDYLARQLLNLVINEDTPAQIAEKLNAAGERIIGLNGITLAYSPQSGTYLNSLSLADERKHSQIMAELGVTPDQFFSFAEWEATKGYREEFFWSGKFLPADANKSEALAKHALAAIETFKQYEGFKGELSAAFQQRLDLFEKKFAKLQEGLIHTQKHVVYPSTKTRSSSQNSSPSISPSFGSSSGINRSLSVDLSLIHDREDTPSPPALGRAPSQSPQPLYSSIPEYGQKSENIVAQKKRKFTFSPQNNLYTQWVSPSHRKAASAPGPNNKNSEDDALPSTPKKK